MFFVCQNAKKKDYILKVDGEIVTCEESPAGLFANFELEKGEHILRFEKRTFYDTPFWYLNIINPLYFIYKQKFIDREKIGYDENFSAIEIVFQCSGKQTERIELMYEKRVNYYPNGKYDFILCERYSGIKNVKISNPSMDKIAIMRYKRTAILSQLFFMTIICGLCISSCVSEICGWLEALLVSLIIICLCSSAVVHIVLEKSVAENLRQFKSKRK